MFQVSLLAAAVSGNHRDTLSRPPWFVDGEARDVKTSSKLTPPISPQYRLAVLLCVGTCESSRVRVYMDAHACIIEQEGEGRER